MSSNLHIFQVIKNYDKFITYDKEARSSFIILPVHIVYCIPKDYWLLTIDEVIF